MAVDQAQVRIDVAAVERALETLEAHFTADRNYWSSPIESIGRARREIEAIPYTFSGGAASLIDPAR